MGGMYSSEPPHGAKDLLATLPGNLGVSPERAVVRKEAVVAGKGSNLVSGRYSCSRDLEQDYTLLGQVLGTGMHGSVVLAEGKANGRKYAVKSLKKRASVSQCRDVRNEAELYLQMDHPHIAQLHRVVETHEAVHLVMEHMEGGEVFDRLVSQRRYGESEAADTLYQMLLAVAYLHTRRLAHRDLKPENFLYHRKDTSLVKLIDFGFAKLWDPNTRMTDVCGSIQYMAPEVVCRSYTTQADMWSVGIIAYTLMTGSPAFSGPNSEMLRRVMAGKVNLSSRFSKLSAAAQSFVEQLLVWNPECRLNAAQALEHPWIQAGHVRSSNSIDVGVLENLRAFAEAPRVHRAALRMMAWSLSTEEQLALREQFLLLDPHKRGCIELKELQASLMQHLQVDGVEANRVFWELGSGGTRGIEYREFLAAALAGEANAREDCLRRTFSRFDRDGRGQVAPEMREPMGDCCDVADPEERSVPSDISTSASLSAASSTSLQPWVGRSRTSPVPPLAAEPASGETTSPTLARCQTAPLVPLFAEVAKQPSSPRSPSSRGLASERLEERDRRLPSDASSESSAGSPSMLVDRRNRRCGTDPFPTAFAKEAGEASDGVQLRRRTEKCRTTHPVSLFLLATGGIPWTQPDKAVPHLGFLDAAYLSVAMAVFR
uniref:Protein kinase domain-containing protein n=1 Tax=Alexandrium monilatum TaxID=311494 RepID=A0A7S4UVD7_9DINO